MSVNDPMMKSNSHDIQRWSLAVTHDENLRAYADCYADPENGNLVTYADHVEAVRQAEQRVLEGRPDPGISEKQAIANHAIYRNGYAAGLTACRDAVQALMPDRVITAGGAGYAMSLKDALAAIDALRGESNG